MVHDMVNKSIYIKNINYARNLRKKCTFIMFFSAFLC